MQSKDNKPSGIFYIQNITPKNKIKKWLAINEKLFRVNQFYISKHEGPYCCLVYIELSVYQNYKVEEKNFFYLCLSKTFPLIHSIKNSIDNRQ